MHAHRNAHTHTHAHAPASGEGDSTAPEPDSAIPCTVSGVGSSPSLVGFLGPNPGTMPNLRGLGRVTAWKAPRAELRRSSLSPSAGPTAAELRGTTSHQQVSGLGLSSSNCPSARILTSRTRPSHVGSDPPPSPPTHSQLAGHDSSLTLVPARSQGAPGPYGEARRIPWTLEQACFSMGLSIFLA